MEQQKFKIEKTSPVIFHFQPTEYTIAETPEEIKDWENKWKNSVGLEFIPKGVQSMTHSIYEGAMSDGDFLK